MFALAVIGSALLLVVVFARPKWGTFLVWPLLFTYPHSWWYHQQFLPLNIGVDDLFCLVLFVAVVLQRNILGRVPIRFGFAFWLITLFAFVAAIANIAGSRAAFPSERILYVKDIMKLGVYWALFYSILHCIDNKRDLRLQFSMFSAAAVAGAVLVILEYFFPYQMEAWANPLTVETRGIQVDGRSAGAFLNPNAAACVLTCSLVLVVTAVRLQRTLLAKAVVYSSTAVLLAGILFTRSRAGLLALGGTFVLMGIWGRNKRLAWLVIVAGVLVAALFPLVREQFESRVVESYDAAGGGWEQNIYGRFITWSRYFETADVRDYLFGQGFRQGVVKNEMESHSTYVSIITVYGIGGVLWATAGLTGFLRRALALRSCPDPFLAMVAAGCMWTLIAWGIYGVSADAVSSPFPRYILFYLVILIDRAHWLASATQVGMQSAMQPRPVVLT